uniref:Uncharacterized protein n=1 Tax=Timema shepardi TaxID=629360 RepID=A0A7R9FW46_TIMSH|nr:unnamed protein product [Timema shepardi]
MREEELEVALKPMSVIQSDKREQSSCESINPLCVLWKHSTPSGHLTSSMHKVVIVGNGAVGKSSMIQRYCKGTFTKDYKKTIGVDFLERQIDEEGNEKPPHFLKFPSMCAFYHMVRTALASRSAEYMSSLDKWETH